MRKTVASLLFALLVLASTILVRTNFAFGDGLVDDSWVTVAPFRVTPKLYSPALGAVTVNGKIYFIGDGINERYDPDANAWTAVTPPPVYHMWSDVVACQNKIYIIGGSPENPTQVYDPLTDTWENKSSIPVTLWEYRATAVDDKIYLIAGLKLAALGIFATSAATYVYDTATDTCSEMAAIPTPVGCYASAVLDGKIYIIGGGTATTTPNNATDLVQIFDPKTNQWTNGKPLPTGVYKAAACSTSGLIAPKRIYVFGGSLRYDGGGLSVSSSAKTITNLTQVYDLETGSWSLAAPLPEFRLSFWLVNVNDALYAIGGEESGSFEVTERYIPLGYDESLLPTPSPSPTPSPTASPTAEPFPTLPVALAIAALVAVAVGLMIYCKKVNHKVGQS